MQILGNVAEWTAAIVLWIEDISSIARTHRQDLACNETCDDRAVWIRRTARILNSTVCAEHRIHHAMAEVTIDAVVVFICEIGDGTCGRVLCDERAWRMTSKAERSREIRILIRDGECGVKDWIAR